MDISDIFFIVKNKKIGGDMNGHLGMDKICIRIIIKV